MTPNEFRDCRLRLGLTQKQFAARLYLTVTTVFRYEKGLSPIRPIVTQALRALMRTRPRVGQRFGQLRVTALPPDDPYMAQAGCDCGAQVTVSLASLVQDKMTHCGCQSLARLPQRPLTPDERREHDLRLKKARHDYYLRHKPRILCEAKKAYRKKKAQALAACS